MTNIPKQFDLKSYTFPLPEDRIAQHPAGNRDESRLMVLDRGTGRSTPMDFADLAKVLPENALLVANNSKVVPARLFGTKDSGGKVEFLLLTPLVAIEPLNIDGSRSSAEVECLLRASKAPKPGQRITFSPDLELTVLTRGEFGQCTARLSWRGQLPSRLCELGHLPLPPYIRRPDTTEDAERYQTTYAQEDKLGSMAAPTAGLHFTPELRRELADRGFGWTEITLYVGYGTFSPVRAKDIRQHRMHREYIEIPEHTAKAVAEAKAQGRPVVPVGTTSVRALEGCAQIHGHVRPFKGWTDIFIYPGFEFKITDHMLTNFHLPESSLLIMVSALAGRQAVLEAYDHALKQGFRFFSYGDAMFII